ncbi:hypothetical protein CK203_019141 [Vitis vinifera]|uniref:Uncharacterized protein n=1 Tax=Vitis vinifera TaxID=29760 RepID=A0A438J7C4_VITVI|nr:hypothetical protein CK203_019141 [Vitis vinifera]
MPYLVRENLFIGNISDAAEILQNGSAEITHILSVLSSASISFFSEWRAGLSIPTKEIRRVFVGGSGSSSESRINRSMVQRVVYRQRKFSIHWNMRARI